VVLGSRVFLTGDLSYTRAARRQTPVAGSPGATSPRCRRSRAGGSALRRRPGVRSARGRLRRPAKPRGRGTAGTADAGLGDRQLPGRASAGKLLATVGVANLFDHDYVEHLSYQRDPFRTGTLVPEPGRNAYVNVSARF